MGKRHRRACYYGHHYDRPGCRIDSVAGDRMIFTIGYAASYRQALDEGPVKKVGRDADKIINPEV